MEEALGIIRAAGQRPLRSSICRILILDQDRDYGRRLAAALSRQNRLPCRCFTAANLSEILLQLRSGRRFDCLLLDARQKLEGEVKNQLGSLPCLRRGLPGRPCQGPGEYPPGIRIEVLAERLAQLNSPRLAANISRRPLILFTAFSERLSSAWLQAFTEKQKASGAPLYYLPFQPSYHLTLPLRFGEGPELSSLLLRLAAGARPRPSELGPCFEAQSGGYYAFRPGGRADDLSLSSLETQRRFLALFRDFIRSRSEASLGLADLRHLPLSRLRALLPFADVLICDVPETSSLADRSARRELGCLLTGLPEEIRFMEMRLPDLRRGELPS